MNETATTQQHLGDDAGDVIELLGKTLTRDIPCITWISIFHLRFRFSHVLCRR